MNSPVDNWSFECEPSGTDGFFFYHEGSREIPFFWRISFGDDVVMIVGILEPDKFAVTYPWAMDRRREIFERVAEGVVRQQNATLTAEIDEQSFCIYFRVRKMA